MAIRRGKTNQKRKKREREKKKLLYLLFKQTNSFPIFTETNKILKS